MPTATTELVEGYAFCPDPHCPSYEQVSAAVRVTHVEWTFVEFGGDVPGNERGVDYESFPLEEGESPPDCPRCGTRMEATTQKRPEYARVSGQDPLRLLSLDQDTIRRAMQSDQSDQAVELANLRTQLAEMRAEMMSMMLQARGAAMPAPDPGLAAPADDVLDEESAPGQPVKRGPGRPRKDA